jgi:hypothetical protein
VEKATVITTEDTTALGGPTGYGRIERHRHEQHRGRVVEVDVSPRVCHALPFERREV